MHTWREHYTIIARKVVEVYNELYDKELKRLNDSTDWLTGANAQAAQADDNRRKAEYHASFFAYQWLENTGCSKRTVKAVWKLTGIDEE